VPPPPLHNESIARAYIATRIGIACNAFILHRPKFFSQIALQTACAERNRAKIERISNE
jgi:hypothetical protein